MASAGNRLAVAVDGSRPRVLVTGGAGFIGATVVRRLVTRGYRVRVLDNLTTGDAAHLDGLEVELIEGDIRDPSTLDRAVHGADRAVHLAAAGSVIASIEDPLTNFDVNVLGTLRVLDAARRAGLRRTVLASTGGALFGRSTPPVDEDALPVPLSPYGASKLAGEGYAQAFGASYALPTVVLRFANVYGPWSERKSGAVTSFLRALREGRPLTIYGDGESSRDLVHVADVAWAVEAALVRDLEPGTVLQISSGRETTIQELARLCRKVAGAPDHPVEHLPPRVGEIRRTFSSHRRANRLLGYRPTVDLEDGLAHTWRWFADHDDPGGATPGVAGHRTGRPAGAAGHHGDRRTEAGAPTEAGARTAAGAGTAPGARTAAGGRTEPDGRRRTGGPVGSPVASGE